MVPVEELYNCTPSLWSLDYCITYNCFNLFYIEEVNNEGAIHAKQNVLRREHGCTAALNMAARHHLYRILLMPL